VLELLNQLTADRIVLMYAVSGAGKTSLLRAGLIPGLQERAFDVLPVMQVRTEPASGITANRYLFSALQWLETARPVDDRLGPQALAQMNFGDYLRRFGPAGDRVLLFDQFEDVLRLDPTDIDAKRGFFAVVGEVLRDRGVWALFSMREEYVAGLEPYLKLLPTQLDSRFRLGLLTPAAARQAVCGPAAQAGIPFRPETAAELVDDLRKTQVQRLDARTVDIKLGPYVEPVQLQVVCQLVWERLPPTAKEIGPEILQGLNVNRILEDYYSQKVAAAARAARVGEGRIRNWVEERLITSQGLRGQALKGYPKSDGLKNDVIDSLIGSYLLRSEQRLGGTWFELAHDRLLEPIRRSNAAWRWRRLKRRLWYVGSGGALLAILSAVLAVVLTVRHVDTIQEHSRAEVHGLNTTLSNTEKSLRTNQQQIETLSDKLEATKEVLRIARDPNAAKFASHVNDQKPAKVSVPKKWEDGKVLRVHFLDGTPDAREKVRQIAPEWTLYTNLVFDFDDPAADPAEVRVSFQGLVSWAMIGTDAIADQIPRNQPTVGLGPLEQVTTEEDVRRYVLHEFGHVLGLFHEFLNPNAHIPWNKPAVYAYFGGPPNNWSNETVDSVFFTPYELPPGFSKPYDPKSIMMYPIAASLLTDPSFAVGTNYDLSKGDKRFVGQLYPFDSAPVELGVNGLDKGEPSRTVAIRRLKLERFRFKATKAGRYVVEALGEGMGPEVYLFGPGDEITQVAGKHEGPVKSSIEAKLAPGVYFIKARYLKTPPANAKAYTIRVTYQPS
jgi:hypothetical protein